MNAATFEFRLADVGEGLHEAEIRRWLVQAGDIVTLDQPLVEVETDKAVVELPAPVAGTVRRLGGAEGAILQVGDVVALIETGGASPETTAGSRAATPQLPTSSQPDARRPLATPAVRKLARDLGVELGSVQGSGRDGRVVAEDVERAAHGVSASAAQAERSRADTNAGTAATDATTAERPNQPVAGTRVPLRGLRRRIAQTMAQSWSSIPHITGFDEFNVAALVATRQRLQPIAEARGLRLTYLPFVIKAVTIALHANPMLNASLDEAAEEIVLHRAINIGIATATPDGLIVPVLQDAASLTLLEIQESIDRLTERARTRQSSAEDLHGGTFTVTNFGALGGRQASPIIRPGEAAILGVGRIEERPWVVDGVVVARPVLALSLAADHRLIDGDVSTAFLRRAGDLLSEPSLMLAEMR